MAFNMKRPIIKGTPFHKASIAKAKQKSIVSQSRMAADGGLVKSGQLLGESYIPKEIDFSINREKPLTRKDVEKLLKNKKKRKLNIKKTKTKKKVKNKEKEEEEKNIVREEIITLDDIQNANENATKGDDVIDTGEGKDNKGEEVNNKKAKKKVYIEEKEDEDEVTPTEDFDGEDGTTSGGSGDGSSDGVNRGYKNWKVREEERNLAEAEALKARMDAESRARQANNTVSKIEPQDIKTISNNVKEPELITTGELPESEKPIPAHLDKNLNKSKPKTNKEFNNLNLSTESNVHDEYYASIGLDPTKVKSKNEAKYNDYTYSRVIDENGVEHDMWSYKNQPITDGQVSDEIYEAIMTETAAQQEKEYNEKLEQQELEKQSKIEEQEKALNSNTPSNDSTQTNLLPQPETTSTNNNVENTDVTEIPPKPRMSDFEGNFLEKAEQYKEAMRAYKEKYDTKYGKSPTQMRDDRVYRLSKPGGVVRKNMIKSGYEPQ